MNKYTCIIIDDEKPARDLIASFLNNYPMIEILGEASNGFEGCLMINERKPDLLFLDVQMPKLTGMEMLEILNQPLPYVIFSTAYEQYAVQAFEKNAVDYLLKPYNKARFDQAIQKFLSESGKNNEENIKNIGSKVRKPEDFVERIPVRDRSRIVVLPVNEIRYFKAENDYVRIVSQEGTFLKQMTMSYLEKGLPDNKFIRIHRSYIVNIDFLKQLEKQDSLNYSVVISDQEKLPVSRSGLKKLNQIIDLN